MSAARVLNPMISEFCKMTTTPHALKANLSCGRQLNRIKRDLFGPANSLETNRIFNEELEKHQELAAKKWGFDFRNGSPLTANPQYIWERVSMQESCIAPEMYTLTRVAHVRPLAAGLAPKTHMEMLMDERADRENISQPATDTDSCDESQDESMVVFNVPAGPNNAETTLVLPRKTQLRKRQPKITEYMKERKRLAQTPKKVSPAKRTRSSSGSSASSSSASHLNQAAANANSIEAHFAPATKQQRNH